MPLWHSETYRRLQSLLQGAPQATGVTLISAAHPSPWATNSMPQKLCP